MSLIKNLLSSGIAPTDDHQRQTDKKVPHLDEDLKTVSFGKIEYYEYDSEYYVIDAEGVDKFDIEQYFASFTSDKVNIEIELPELTR